jgi:hypothetical protein
MLAQKTQKPYPEATQQTYIIKECFRKIYFNIILSSRYRTFKQEDSPSILYAFLISPTQATCPVKRKDATTLVCPWRWSALRNVTQQRPAGGGEDFWEQL